MKVKIIRDNELGLAEAQTKLEVARYFSVEGALLELKRNDNSRVSWVKSRVPWSKVEKL